MSISTPVFNTTEDESFPVTSVAIALLGPNSHASKAFEPTLAVPFAKVSCGHSFVVGIDHSPSRAALLETKTLVVLAATSSNPIYVPVISTSTAIALSNAAVTQPAATSPVSVFKSVTFAGIPSAAFIQPTTAPVASPMKVKFHFPTSSFDD